MTADEARDHADRAASLIAELQSHFHTHFDGARGPLRDHCFGYSCGVGIAACVGILEAMKQVRVSLSQVEQAQRQMSAISNSNKRN